VNASFDPQTLAANSVFNMASVIISASVTVPIFINIAVFAHPNLKDPAFKILLTVSIVDFVYMIMEFIHAYLDIYCGPKPFMCGSDGQLAALAFDQYIDNYLTSCMAVYSILSEIFLTTQRLFLLQHSNFLKDVKVKIICPIMAVISLIYYTPYFFAFDFVTTDNVYLYKNRTYVEWNLVLNEFGQSPVGSWLLSSLSILRLLLVSVVLLALNIVSVIAFRKYFSKKMHLTGKDFFPFRINNKLKKNIHYYL
jgi:hypothetical protein